MDRKGFSIKDSGSLHRLGGVEFLEFDVEDDDFFKNNEGNNYLVTTNLPQRPPPSYLHPLFPKGYPLPVFRGQTLILPRRNPAFSVIPAAHRHLLLHAHLSHLRICTKDSGVTLEALVYLTQSLVSLTLEVFPTTPAWKALSPRHPPPVIQPKITFERLVELTINVLDDNADMHPWDIVQGEVLERLECPSLAALVLRSAVVWHPGFTEPSSQVPHAVATAFQSFIYRSNLSTRLRDFVFVGFRMVDWQVLEVIEMVPGVRGLTIGGWAGYGPPALKEPMIYTSLFFERFKRDTIDAAVFLPELKILRVQSNQKLEKEAEEFLEDLGRSLEVHVVDC
ncbi:hypothetical protein AAF712_010950 [Marasmius tenuissimus]|uniref:Uncharacterized protein n=1 Tax=Marasmius tenuissimus TaxID=585030 RepID=A0ABR2ZME3_9AGAR